MLFAEKLFPLLHYMRKNFSLTKAKIPTYKIPVIVYTKTRAKENAPRQKPLNHREFLSNIQVIKNMSNNSRKTLVPEAKEALNRFKMEAANEVGVNLKEGYIGDLTSMQAGSVGGQMGKKLIQSYEQGMK